MSFFGFNTTLPRDQGHPARAPGFSQPQDPFAGLGGGNGPDDDAIDFEDTYDGLGDQLDDADDALNDDTFGAGPATQQAVGKDFDFAGNTSKISGTLQEEQMLYEARTQHRPPPPQQPKPARTGYESYKDPNYIPQLEVRPDIWGLQPKQPAQPPPQQPQAPARKIMNVDEIEAMMRAQALNQATAPPPMPPMPSQAPPPMAFQHQQQFPPQQHMYQGIPGQHAPPMLHQHQVPQHQVPQHQVPQHQVPQPPPAVRQHELHAELPAHPAHTQPPRQPTILQRQRATPEIQVQQQRSTPPQPAAQEPPSHPRQILQNPHRLSGHGQPMSQQGVAPRGPSAGHNRGPSFQGINHPDMLLQLSEEERAAFLEEDAKRAKRNHKIALIGKDNGLMTPQDKNFITRIQLQQLMSATGNLEDAGPGAALAEDFYYHVYSQIRGAPRQTPNQPANQFAQTYLFQTNSRYGGRRNARGGDNHIQRMEQQVQRAVEAAKAKPKAKQLVVEGSLGKIAFSNSKTPRPLLNIKRQETTEKHPKLQKPSIADRKEVLRNIERVWTTLLRMDDLEQAVPAPINAESSPEAIQKHMEWRSKLEDLHDELWQNTRIMEPLFQSNAPHPFIAMLSYAKGKKLIPRLFRHITEHERINVVTMIVVHLDQLSVVSQAIATPDEPLNPTIRQEIDLFVDKVIPPVLAHVSHSPLNVITGLLGLLCDRTNLLIVARTEVGMRMLTMLVSQAALIQQSTPDVDMGAWEQWTELYNRMFDAIEPALPYLFPGTVNDTNDIHIWSFLAAMGVGASPEQQQRLVLGVKDRVMETVAVSKTLPAEMAASRLANVNLFMRAIGLDVELLG